MEALSRWETSSPEASFLGPDLFFGISNVNSFLRIILTFKIFTSHFLSLVHLLPIIVSAVITAAVLKLEKLGSSSKLHHLTDGKIKNQRNVKCKTSTQFVYAEPCVTVT